MKWLACARKWTLFITLLPVIHYFLCTRSLGPFFSMNWFHSLVSSRNHAMAKQRLYEIIWLKRLVTMWITSVLQVYSILSEQVNWSSSVHILNKQRQTIKTLISPIYSSAWLNHALITSQNCFISAVYCWSNWGTEWAGKNQYQRNI